MAKGQQPHKPTDEQRRQVLNMTGMGLIQTEVATWLKIDLKTLRKYYRRELDTGAIEANVRVANALYTNATKHNATAAQIWWTKARMGWKDTTPIVAAGERPVILEVRWQPAQIANADTHTAPTIDADAATTVVWQDETC